MTDRDAEVVVVLGGGSGIGQSLAGIAHDAGWAVAVIDRVVAPDGHPADKWITLEAREPGSMAKAAHMIVDSLGPISGLVITAGVTDPARVMEIEAGRVQEIIDVNVTSAITTVAAFAPVMRDDSAIVLFSSVAAHRGGGFFGASTYAASKSALEGLTRGLARELGPRGIRVNCVAPGPTATPMLSQASQEVIERVSHSTFLDRLARPEEIAEVALFLIGPKASFMTGAVVAVDGGAALK